jgi:hypothetical protein
MAHIDDRSGTESVPDKQSNSLHRALHWGWPAQDRELNNHTSTCYGSCFPSLFILINS